MKRSDIQPMTVIYAIGTDRDYRRGIVLFAQPWRTDRRTATDGSFNSYVTKYVPVTGRTGMTGGFPAVYASDAEVTITDEQLRGAAVAAAQALTAGRLPELPRGIRLQLAQARAILRPWTEQLQLTARRREATERDHQARVAKATAEREAAERILELVGDGAVRESSLAAPDSSASTRHLLPGSWQALEALCEAYAAAKLAETTPVAAP